MGPTNGRTLLSLAAPLALTLACSEAEPPTLEEFSRAQGVRFELAGTWTDERLTIHIRPIGVEKFEVSGWLHSSRETPHGGAPTVDNVTAQGRAREGVLHLHPPLDGITALYPCLIGGEPMLLPDVGVTIEPGDPPMPRGRAFRCRHGVQLPLEPAPMPRLDGYLPGPEDENYPSPWREAYGGG